MRWIYILECENDMYYVGQTKRLYRRFWEHNTGFGGLNTQNYQPKCIVAIYKVNIIGKFYDYDEKVRNMNYSFDHNIYYDTGDIFKDFNYADDSDNEYLYDNLWVENIITERMMLNNETTWRNIRGGKYVRFDVEYNFPTNQFIKCLPMCECGLPCDVKKNEDKCYLYFRCPKKNMWGEMREYFDIYETPCNFFMKYINDSQYKLEYEKRKQNIINLTYRSYWLKQLVGGHYTYCVGGCGKEYDCNNTVRYFGKSAINLCFDCFTDKYAELTKKYKIVKEVECLL